MKIGFDLDKIFIDYPPFVPDKVIDRLYKKKSNGVLLYRIPSHPEQLLRRISHASFFRPPIKKNLEFLKSLPEKKHELYLISSRFSFLEKQTNSLMKKLMLDTIFKKMYFNFENKQPHLFKDEVLKQLNLDYYIDDDLGLLKYLAKHNSKTKFLWLYPKESTISLPKNITKITTLTELTI